jgi:Holliday junction resolvase-like predicted endonuclease
VEEVTRHVKSGTSTKDIYRKAFKLINQESTVAAVHYSLKRAILELGPTGYAFEHFVGRYFSELGYETEVGVTLQGKYVGHEVDVVARTPSEKVFVECKFHNSIGKKNDIKTALYVKARWDDLKEGKEGKDLVDFYLASNTAFTKDVIQYAQGTGLKLLGINAPADESFIDKIRRYKLYPVTSIRRIKKYIKDALIENDILTCKELLHEEKLLYRLGLKENEIDLIFKDIHYLLERKL